MNTEGWLTRLSELQQLMLDMIIGITTPDFRRQFHQDLSPLGWHLGHCLFTEIYWIREVVLKDNKPSSSLKSLYIPEMSPKPRRGASLPEHDELCEWAESTQEENRHLLIKLVNSHTEHELMQNHYLFNFLFQHYAQHIETMMYILSQRQLQQEVEFIVQKPLQSQSISHAIITVDKGRYQIGTADGHVPYDNEHPFFSAHLDEFHIAVNPVKNGEFLGFMEDGGYRDKRNWSNDGWLWCTGSAISHPEHWRRDTNGHWYGIDHNGPYPLLADEPLHGINYYEASAFAKWAGARLPHEYEWEAANQSGLFDNSGKVWEWCANAFHPYPGFRVFPYEGYSVPYFDGNHFTLKGGSLHTRAPIKRPSFRNYYQPDKRHIYAGARLAYS
jgi:iron(II)-dependent oxidoreductase